MGSTLDGSGKITLDKETFKVLASETRIGILKRLDMTQMTVSDLARSLDMSKATLFEHLEKLIKIGLIKKKEDQRKWVYYKLTWKGKNILHPERTKIAIVLTVFIAAFIIIASIYLIKTDYDIFSSEDEVNDITKPNIEFITVEDITEKTVAPEDMIVKLSDDSGIDEGSVRMSYAISIDYTQNFNFLTWRKLDTSIDQGTVTARFPTIYWEIHPGEYLYIECTVRDKAGNFAQNVYVEYIEKIYEGSIDLSISKADVKFEPDFTKLPLKGLRTITTKIFVHNTGSVDVHNINISIFTANPDRNYDGIVDNYTGLISTQNINYIGKRDMGSIEVNLELNLSYTHGFWVAIDTSNLHNESDELNNIIKINLKSESSSSAIPEFPLYIGIFILVLLSIISSVFRSKKQLVR